MGVMDQAKDKAEELKNKAEELAADMKDKVHHKADEHGSPDKAGQVKDDLHDAGQHAKDATQK